MTYIIPAQLSLFDPALSTAFFEDFHNTEPLNNTVNSTVISPYFTRGLAGAAAFAAGTVLSNPDTGGAIVDLSSGTTAAGIAEIFQNGSNFLNQGQCDLSIRAAVPILSTGVERFVVRVGFNTNLNFADAGDGVFFSYDDVSSPNWMCRCVKAGVATVANSGVPVVAGQFYKLRSITNADLSAVNFYIGTQLVASIGTNIPITKQIIRASMIKNIGVTARDLLIDWVNFQQTFTNARG